MEGVILAGGEGTRLQPLTCNTPKAMVPLLSHPFRAPAALSEKTWRNRGHSCHGLSP